MNDEVGRVVRFDSFSKILSSGMRLGFITAPKAICDAMDLVTANTKCFYPLFTVSNVEPTNYLFPRILRVISLQTPSTTQMMVFALLRQWKTDGLLEHCKRVSAFYLAKRDMFEEHLGDVAEWATPVAGMFLYIKVSPKQAHKVYKNGF